MLRENQHQFLPGSFPSFQVCSHKTLKGLGSLGRCPGPDMVPASLPYLASKGSIRDPALSGHEELGFIFIAVSRKACQPQLHAGLLAVSVVGSTGGPSSMAAVHTNILQVRLIYFPKQKGHISRTPLLSAMDS